MNHGNMICGVRTEGYPFDGAIGLGLKNFYELLQLNLQIKKVRRKRAHFNDCSHFSNVCHAHFFAHIKDNLATTWPAGFWFHLQTK